MYNCLSVRLSVCPSVRRTNVGTLLIANHWIIGIFKLHHLKHIIFRHISYGWVVQQLYNLSHSSNIIKYRNLIFFFKLKLIRLEPSTIFLFIYFFFLNYSWWRGVWRGFLGKITICIKKFGRKTSKRIKSIVYPKESKDSPG